VPVVVGVGTVVGIVVGAVVEVVVGEGEGVVPSSTLPPHAASEELIALGTGDWLAGLPEEDAALILG